jgi:tungstate transport system permease protein
MESILNAFKEAFWLIVRFDPDFYRIILLTLMVNGIATLIGAVLGIPAGVALAEYRFPGRKPLLVFTHAMMGLPPVVAGVFFVLIFGRSGPLGFMNILYSVTALILVQVVLAVPIIAGFTNASLEDVDPRIGLQARSLGASRLQSTVVKTREARAGLVAAVIAGFGGVVSEVGAIMIVGGNIKGQTRMLTTDIVLNMRVGKSEIALAEGLVLIFIAIIINIFLTRLQAEKGRDVAETKGITGAYING